MNETRDDLGRVLCCHGRPIMCNECGEDYAVELNQPLDTALRACAEAPAPTAEALEKLRWLKTPDAGGYSPLQRLRAHMAGNRNGKTLVARQALDALMSTALHFDSLQLRAEAPATDTEQSSGDPQPQWSVLADFVIGGWQRDVADLAGLARAIQDGIAISPVAAVGVVPFGHRRALRAEALAPSPDTGGKQE